MAGKTWFLGEAVRTSLEEQSTGIHKLSKGEITSPGQAGIAQPSRRARTNQLSAWAEASVSALGRPALLVQTRTHATSPEGPQAFDCTWITHSFPALQLAEGKWPGLINCASQFLEHLYLSNMYLSIYVLLVLSGEPWLIQTLRK